MRFISKAFEDPLVHILKNKKNDSVKLLYGRIMITWFGQVRIELIIGYTQIQQSLIENKKICLCISLFCSQTCSYFLPKHVSISFPSMFSFCTRIMSLFWTKQFTRNWCLCPMRCVSVCWRCVRNGNLEKSPNRSTGTMFSPSISTSSMCLAAATWNKKKIFFGLFFRSTFHKGTNSQ